MTIAPAYGRDYKSKKEVLAAFDANKDFIVHGMNNQGNFNDDGRYVNKENLLKSNTTYVQIRYKRMTMVVGVRLRGK